MGFVTALGTGKSIKYRYNDDGCDLAPSCLNCPLPECKHDLETDRNRDRDARIVAMRTRGATVQQIGQVFGLSDRTVYRITSPVERKRHASRRI